MSALKLKVITPPENLRTYVECFRVAGLVDQKDVTVRVCPNGFPGIAFNQRDGETALKSIVTPAQHNYLLPTLFLYGQVTTLSEMHFAGPYTSLQIVLKPYALWSLFGLSASLLTNKSLSAEGFDAEELNRALLAASNVEEQIALCCDFLAGRLVSARHNSDIFTAIEFIDQNIGEASVKATCNYIGLSPRQLERLFKDIIGVSPHLYIRIRRINAALRLMDSGKYGRLVDIAHEMNFHDQPHFIRDIKEFSGLTPKSITQRVGDVFHDQVGTSYLLV